MEKAYTVTIIIEETPCDGREHEPEVVFGAEVLHTYDKEEAKSLMVDLENIVKDRNKVSI